MVVFSLAVRGSAAAATVDPGSHDSDANGDGDSNSIDGVVLQ